MGNQERERSSYKNCLLWINQYYWLFSIQNIPDQTLWMIQATVSVNLQLQIISKNKEYSPREAIAIPLLPTNMSHCKSSEVSPQFPAKSVTCGDMVHSWLQHLAGILRIRSPWFVQTITLEKQKNLCNPPCPNQTICPAAHYGIMQIGKKAEGGPFCPVCLIQKYLVWSLSSITGVYSHYIVSSPDTKGFLLPTELYPCFYYQDYK